MHPRSAISSAWLASAVRWSELKLQYRSERSLASGQLEGSEMPPGRLDVPVIEDKFLGSVRLQPVQAVKLNELVGALATGGCVQVC